MVISRRDLLVDGVLLLMVLTTAVVVTPELRAVFLDPLEQDAEPEAALPGADLQAVDVVRLYIQEVYAEEYRSAYERLSPGLQVALSFEEWRSDLESSRATFVEQQGRTYTLDDAVLAYRDDQDGFVETTILVNDEPVTTDIVARQTGEGIWRVGEVLDPYDLEIP